MEYMTFALLFTYLLKTYHCTYFFKIISNKKFEEKFVIPSCPSLLTCTHKCNLKKLHAVYKNKQCYCVQLLEEKNSDDKNGFYERIPKIPCRPGYAGNRCHKVVTKLSERKPATQSSYSPLNSNAVASKGVDVNTNGDLFRGSCFCTAAEPAPWWQVDVLKNAIVTGVNLFPSTDCCSDRAANLEVMVKFPGSTEWNTCASIKQLGFTNLNSNCEEEIFGRIIRVVQYNNEIFHLCEVQVYGYFKQASLRSEIINPEIDEIPLVLH